MNEKTVNDLRKWIDEFSGIDKYTTENIKDWIDNKPVTLNLNEISTMPVNLYGDKVIDATITEVLTNNITPESAAEVLEVEMKNNFSMDKAVKRYSLDNPEVTIPFGRIVPAPIIDLDDWTEIVPPVGQEDEYLKHLESNNWFDCEHKYDEESMKHYLRSLDAIPVHYKLNTVNFSKKNPITKAKEQVLKNFSNPDAKPTPLEVAREILPEFISINPGEGDSLVISVDDENEYEDLAKSLTAVVQELSIHYPKADYIITEDNKSATVNFSKKDNKGVNMNISKEFIPTMDNYTQFGYTKNDDEIIVNKGSKKLVLEGADALEWLDTYWNAKNADMESKDNFSSSSIKIQYRKDKRDEVIKFLIGANIRWSDLGDNFMKITSLDNVSVESKISGMPYITHVPNNFSSEFSGSPDYKKHEEKIVKKLKKEGKSNKEIAEICSAEIGGTWNEEIVEQILKDINFSSGESNFSVRPPIRFR